MSGGRRRVVASKPTRYGCRTCRIRRIKCDQARPSCQKCTSTGRSCDGYQENSRLPAENAATARFIRPASNETQSLTPMLVIAPNTSITADLDETDRLAFDYFLERTVEGLRQLCPENAWIQTALQLSGESAPIAFAISALGSASRAQMPIAHTTLVPPRDPQHHDISIRHYGKAIASLQQYIDKAATSDVAVEPVLLACLILACLEVFRGRGEAAALHLQLGGRVAYEHSGLASRHTLNQSHRLGCSSRLVTRQLRGTFDSLQQIFIQADEADWRSMQPLVLPPAIVTRNSFASAHQARLHLYALTDASEHARAELLRISEANLSARHRGTQDFAMRYCLAHCLTRVISLNNHLELRKQFQALVRAHAAWDHAFSDLETAQPHLQFSPSILAMRLRHFFSKFTISTCREVKELLADRYFAEFEQAVVTAEQYLCKVEVLPERETGRCTPAGPERHRTFSLQLTLLPALNLICYKCREPRIRRQAVSLLHRAKRREGLFWSGEIAAPAEAIQSIEECRAREFLGLHADNTVPDLSNVSLPEAARFSEVILAPDRLRRANSLRFICGRFLDEETQKIELVEYEGLGYPIHAEKVSSATFSFSEVPS